EVAGARRLTRGVDAVADEVAGARGAAGRSERRGLARADVAREVAPLARARARVVAAHAVGAVAGQAREGAGAHGAVGEAAVAGAARAARRHRAAHGLGAVVAGAHAVGGAARLAVRELAVAGAVARLRRAAASIAGPSGELPHMPGIAPLQVLQVPHVAAMQH